MDKHSKLLSPSASKRWTVCTAAQQEIIDRGLGKTTSVYAERGSLQHKYMQELYMELIEPAFSARPEDLTEEEWDHVLIANRSVNEVLRGVTTTIERTEMGVQLNAPYQDCFGTLDHLVYDKTEKRLYVIDYKFGYTRVKSEMNTQLLIYAMAACFTLSLQPKSVVLVIVQPKVSQTADMWGLTFKELIEWYADVLVPAMDTILNGKGQFKAGSHCNESFCPLQAQCPAQEKDIMQQLDSYFEDNTRTTLRLDENKLAQILDLSEIVEPWFNAARALANDKLMQGEEVEGYKLVHGKSNRMWANEEEADTFLKGQKLKQAERYNYKLISPAQAEKRIKGKLESSRTKNRFEKLVTKPTGKLKLVKEDDPRHPAQFERIDDAVDEMYGDIFN